MNRPNAEISAGEACVPNIGFKGRERRLRSGLIWLALGVAVLLWAVVDHHRGWWLYAVLSAAFLLGMLGVFQAREKT